MNMTNTNAPSITSKRSSTEPETSLTMTLDPAAGFKKRKTAPNTRSRKFHTASTIRVKRLAPYHTSTFGERRRKRTTALFGNALENGR